MLDLRSISKKFGEVPVLKNVSLRVEKGEIHGLLGENGAGKTTLMNVATGLLRPDSGEILIDGAAVQGVPGAAASTGLIGMVHQQFLLVPSLTVAENLALGIHGSGFSYFREAAEAEARSLSDEFKLELDPGARVGALPVAIQQRVEILKAMKGRPKVLILDEPTAVLTPQESDQLILSLRGLAASGMAIVFISHKHREILEACGRVTVLRLGEKVGTIETKGVTSRILAEMMMGSSGAKKELVPDVSDGTRAPGSAKAAIEIRDLWVDSESGGTGLRGISLDVAAGEIVAVVGVEGNGQFDLEEVLGGLRVPRAGKALVCGFEASEARRRGGLLGFIPGDREETGLIPEMDLVENLALAPEGRPTGFLGLLRRKAQALRASELLNSYDVRASGIRSPARTLSGGNKQKLVLARELSTEPPVVVACHPTRGLDVMATAAVQARLSEARGRGAAVLLMTAELDEAMDLADRLFVIWRGLLRRAPPKAGRIALGKLMLGAVE